MPGLKQWSDPQSCRRRFHPVTADILGATPGCCGTWRPSRSACRRRRPRIPPGHRDAFVTERPQLPPSRCRSLMRTSHRVTVPPFKAGGQPGRRSCWPAPPGVRPGAGPCHLRVTAAHLHLVGRARLQVRQVESCGSRSRPSVAGVGRPGVGLFALRRPSCGTAPRSR